jgi:class 3 adenylate cyclase
LKFRALFVCWILFCFFHVKGESGSCFTYGNPIVRYYHPLEYKGYSQNWFIGQDKQGILFVANGDGILEYDGNEWNLHQVGNHLTPTSFLIEDKCIWVGAKGDFGFFLRNGSKHLDYVSLKPFAPSGFHDFGFVTRIFRSGNNIYFGTSEKTFIWNGSSVEVITHGAGSGLYRAGEFVLLFDSNKGIQLLTGSTVLNIVGGEYFKARNIREILPYDMERFLIVTRYDGMFVVSFDFSVIYAPRLMIDQQLYSETYRSASENIIYHCLRLSGGQFAISTMLGGTYLMNADGSEAGVLNRQAKIPNETHSFLYEDTDGNLWIALDNGIAKVLMSGNFTYFDERSGLFGSVIDVNFFHGSLFAGTWQGLFFMDLESAEKGDPMFASFRSIKSQCWKLELIDYKGVQKLWAATSDGLYVIDENFNEFMISDGLYYSVLQLEKYPQLIFAGQKEGIDIFCIEGNTVRLIETIKIEGEQSRVVSIQEDKDGMVWFGAEFQGIFSVEITKNGKDFLFQMSNFASEFPISEYYYVYKYFADVFFVSREGIFMAEYDQNGEISGFKRVIYNHLSSFQTDYYINIFYQDRITGDAWFQMGVKDRAFKYFGKFEMKSGTIQFSFNPYKLFPGYEIYTMRSDSSGLLWLGCDDGVFILNDNVHFKRDKKFDAIIRTIEIGNDSLFYYGNIVEGLSLPVSHFSSDLNNIRFTFSSNSFIDEEKTIYRYRLEGFDDDWSQWNQISSKEYTNLPPGNYVFSIEARDIIDDISTQARFEFRIHRPWYSTWIAYVFYGIALAAFAYLINIYTNRRLIRAKQRLENIVERRTNELRMQKREIENEKEKSDRLLLNILPVKVAEELKSQGYSKAEYFESATVLFTDFAGFTKIAERESSQELIDKLERFFILFDEIVIRNKMEKIKTIGDSHMSVGGVPVSNETHVFDAVIAAIEMIEVMKKARSQQEWASDWHLRIGIHTGSVIAGIVGKRKFAYDVWGDTVNMSSRLQETGAKDRINISKEIFDIISPYFECEHRGKVEVKHKGLVEMYFVYRLKPEYSKNVDGTKPNLEFRDIYWNL